MRLAFIVVSSCLCVVLGRESTTNLGDLRGMLNQHRSSQVGEGNAKPQLRGLGSINTAAKFDQ